MPELVVDGRPVSVSDGATLLDAARKLGIAVPTLCHHEGLPHRASCMVCLVEDQRSGRLVPSCATQALEADRVRTDGARITAARRRSVEMLLAEHDGDCEAPCVRACPAHPDIPGAIRRMAAGDLIGALARLMERLPLARTLAATCPAPCRQACRRRRVDSAVDICSLMRAAAARLASADPYTPPTGRPTGKCVAVVGAGPAGLSAAYFLAREGHRCLVFERRERPGGELPVSLDILEPDLGVLRRLGVEVHTGCPVRSVGDLERRIRGGNDAVVLAVGSRQAIAAFLPEAACRAGVFACGNAAFGQPTRPAVRSVADGREVARSVSAFLAGGGAERADEPRRFESRRSVLSENDLALLAKRAGEKTGVSPKGETPETPADPLVAEALRCLDCDCIKKESCRLRRLAEELGADAQRFASADSRRIEMLAGSTALTLEQGKCIRCGICVRIAEAAGDRPGLAFSGRGSEVQVRVPFGDDLGRALPSAASACAAACPTGALAWDTAGQKGARE